MDGFRYQRDELHPLWCHHRRCPKAPIGRNRPPYPEKNQIEELCKIDFHIKSASKSFQCKIILYRINAFEEKIIALLARIAEVRVRCLLVELCPAEVAKVGLKKCFHDLICISTKTKLREWIQHSNPSPDTWSRSSCCTHPTFRSALCSLDRAWRCWTCNSPTGSWRPRWRVDARRSAFLKQLCAWRPPRGTPAAEPCAPLNWSWKHGNF